MSMQSVQEIAEDIVAREGGFVDDPADPGGATKHGVTIGTMRRLGIDLTGDGRVSVADVRRLSRAQAIEIYIKHYYIRTGIAALPVPLRPSVFDMYVNSGANAVRILQRLLNATGQVCAVDGTIGPQTVRAAVAAYEMAPTYLADAYGMARRDYYYDLGDTRPRSRRYARRRDGGKGGWITRAEAFISPKHHLSEAQHRARVAAWG